MFDLNGNEISNLVFTKLAQEHGVQRARIIQLETYNELLVRKVEELEAQLEPADTSEEFTVESGEGE